MTSPKLLVATLLLVVSCSDDAPRSGADAGPVIPTACVPTSPDSYDGSGWDANAGVELKLRVPQWNAFVDPMKAAVADPAPADKPTAAALKALHEAGSPSLRSITSPYFAGKIDRWLGEFQEAWGNRWTPAMAPAGMGGKFGPDLFSKGGLDLRQAIEKGSLGAAFYNHVATLMKGTVTAATIDRMVAAFGAHPSFPADDKAPSNPDLLTAIYAKRRTKKEPAGTGLYFDMKRDFVVAQAAAQAGAPCKAVLDGALQRLRNNWERVLFATVIYYAEDARVKLSRDNATEAEISAALHGIAEGASFVHGFRTLPADARTTSDAQIDELLELFGAPAEGDVTVYRFATEGAVRLPRLVQVIARVSEIHGFTAEQVALFKVNQ